MFISIGKAVKKSQERIVKQLQDLWDYAAEVVREELKQPEDPSPEKELKTVEKINSALLGREVDPKVKQKLRYAKKNWPGKLAEYEQKKQRSHYPLLWCYFDVALVLLWYGFAVREIGVWRTFQFVI